MIQSKHEKLPEVGRKGRLVKGFSVEQIMSKGYLKEVTIGIEGTEFTQANEAGGAAITAWLAENVGWALYRHSVKLAIGQVRFLVELVG